MRRAGGFAALTLLPLLLLTAQAQEAPAIAPGEDLSGRLPRLIIQRTTTGQVFSGTFKGQQATEPNTTTGAAAPLQIEYAAQYSGLEVYSYNASALGSTANVEWSFGSPEEQRVQQARAICRQLLIENPDIKLCEPDLPTQLDRTASMTPNDPLRPQEYALQAINMTGAWQQRAFGSANVRVCYVDTGVDYFHPDLQPNLWINKKEIPNDGIDNDNNGVVDDIYGVNFVQGGISGDPYDDNGHGTFVAGVAGAVANNGIGITGISQAVSIVACKFMDATGNGWISDAIRCWDYCTQQDAHIISNSWGVYATSAAMQQSAQALNSRGILVMASAGNNAQNTDAYAHVPSTLTTPNILAVGASQQDGSLWTGSNYGVKSVDVAAPGVKVLGLAVGGSYISMTGTSMATPHVTGLAAIILAKFYNNGYQITTRYPSVGLAAQVKSIITQSCTALPGQKKLLYGLINATKAVSLVPARAPPRTVTNTTNTTTTITNPVTTAEGGIVQGLVGGGVAGNAMIEAPAGAPEGAALAPGQGVGVAGSPVATESAGCVCSPAPGPAAATPVPQTAAVMGRKMMSMFSRR